MKGVFIMTKKITIRQIAYDAMLAAMYFVLSFASIKLGNMKISVSGLPILVGALLFGPADGFLIGLVGAFLEQMVSQYGLTATTVLWILPPAIRGLLAGAYAKKRDFSLSPKQTVFITVLTALVLTVLNTAVMYIDSKIFGYYSKAYVFGGLVSRFVIGVLTAIVFSLILYPLIKGIKKNIRL